MCLDFKELKVPCVRSNFTLKLYRDDERNGVDHLQKKRHLKYLLPNVPLKQTNTDILSALSFTNNRKSLSHGTHTPLNFSLSLHTTT